MVPGTGLEPACLAALAPKASVSANSTIPACPLLTQLRRLRYLRQNRLLSISRDTGHKKMDPLLTADPLQLNQLANRQNYCTVSVIG
jgi:hypothetical protein